MTKPHVLIVDDDGINIRLLQAALKSDYRVSTASGGRQAIAIAASRPRPDLILLDVMMPEIDGYETCRILKADAQTRDIPVIFVTAHNGSSEEIKGIELGAIDFISKPINTAVVRVRVRNHVELKRHRDLLEERTAFLDRIMDTVETGGVIIDAADYRILRVNRIGARMIGSPKVRLIGRDCRDFLSLDDCRGTCGDGGGEAPTSDRLLKTVDGRTVHVRQSCVRIQLRDRDCRLVSFLDISDIKNLLAKQVLSIRQAKRILDLVNGPCPRYIRLRADLDLFCRAVSMPCHLEGGDHVFVRRVAPAAPGGAVRTVISLKDQSGHEVASLLKSIYTDILHNDLIRSRAGASLEEHAGRLNDGLYRSDVFGEDDFFTAVMGEIDHDSLVFRFVSAGHPPFLLVRDGRVLAFPDVEGGRSGSNLPMAIIGGVPYSAAEVPLTPGDRLVFYSDGLSEMPVKNGGGVLTVDRMKRLLSEILAADPSMPVSVLSRRLLERVAAMSGEEVVPGVVNTSGDDVTILCIELEDRTACQERRITPSGFEDLSRQKGALYRELRSRWEEKGYASPETRLQTVLEEAVLNAWKHGNREDHRRTVTVRWRFGNDFHLEVEDEGEGFDFDHPPDPASEANRRQPGGRGLFLIRHHADQTEWRENGTRLATRFRRDGRPKTAAA